MGVGMGLQGREEKGVMGVASERGGGGVAREGGERREGGEMGVEREGGREGGRRLAPDPNHLLCGRSPLHFTQPQSAGAAVGMA